MNLLIKSIQILNEGNPFHKKVCDVYVENGNYKKIAAKIDIKDCVTETAIYDAKKNDFNE